MCIYVLLDVCDSALLCECTMCVDMRISVHMLIVAKCVHNNMSMCLHSSCVNIEISMCVTCDMHGTHG